MVKLVQVGSGRWGQRYIATLASFPEVELKVANRETWKNLIDQKPDGVIVCTPPDSHIEIAQYALKKNIAILIEKPLSLSLSEAETLKKFTAPILVNHIHLFSDGYQNMKKSIAGKKITHIDSQGYGQGPVRPYSSLWDYGPHDLSMILDLVGRFPEKITASESNPSSPESLFTIEMDFGDFYTKSVVGNGALTSARTISVDCNSANFFYDDKKRPETHSAPLTTALRVFIDAIGGKNDSRLGLALSLDVMKILEHCQKLLRA